MYVIYHHGFGEAIYGSLNNALRFIARRMGKPMSKITASDAVQHGWSIQHERSCL